MGLYYQVLSSLEVSVLGFIMALMCSREYYQVKLGLPVFCAFNIHYVFFPSIAESLATCVTNLSVSICFRVCKVMIGHYIF